jgi:hypothetical protein
MRVETESEAPTRRKPFQMPFMLGFCLFAAVAVFFLWEEHRAHVLGALPYALLLLCPIIHLFMHRGHGGHGGGGGSGHDGNADAVHRNEGGNT